MEFGSVIKLRTLEPDKHPGEFSPRGKVHKTEPREGIRSEITSSSSSKADEEQPPTSHTSNPKMNLLLVTGR